MSAPNYHVNSINWGNFGTPAWRPLQKASCPFKRGPQERWPSGLRRTLGKRVCGKPYRGFESHSLRQPGRRLQQSLRVFARELGRDVRVRARGLLRGLFVHLEAGLARPAALEIVPDGELQ